MFRDRCSHGNRRLSPRAFFDIRESAQLDILHRAVFESCSMPPLHDPIPYEHVAELIGENLELDIRR
jgi:hypothetical protein